MRSLAALFALLFALPALADSAYVPPRGTSAEYSYALTGGIQAPTAAKYSVIQLLAGSRGAWLTIRVSGATDADDIRARYAPALGTDFTDFDTPLDVFNADDGHAVGVTAAKAAIAEAPFTGGVPFAAPQNLAATHPEIWLPPGRAFVIWSSAVNDGLSLGVRIRESR